MVSVAPLKDVVPMKLGRERPLPFPLPESLTAVECARPPARYSSPRSIAALANICSMLRLMCVMCSTTAGSIAA